MYEQNYYAVESIARRQSGHEPTLRFWNAESRARGAGYVQLPVYFLSLSRLFPIGETTKTQSMPAVLTEEELEYCITNYRKILSIHNINGTPSVGIEKATASRIFSGVNDDTHDIFTNSAGEGNITRILLAVLSFKRLKEQYGRDYKGGILLIDELDATLYGFSQTKLVEYLWEAAGEYKIQIVFTTHSPIINTDDFKHWYSQVETALGDQNILFEFWLSEHRSEVDAFVEQFITLFNMLAERNDTDALPRIISDEQSNGDEFNP